jgi:hypothetical protein
MFRISHRWMSFMIMLASGSLLLAGGCQVSLQTLEVLQTGLLGGILGGMVWLIKNS